jgi:predicted pyridoxine 5'-phosphate oxidase superfamily flavin-nucleotide-binding protein
MSYECCGPILSPVVKDTIINAPFLALVSVSKEGKPHTIVVGKVKEIKEDDTLIFGIYKMQKTRENLSETGFLQVAAVVGKSGYRITGNASFTDSEVILTVETVESLL